MELTPQRIFAVGFGSMKDGTPGIAFMISPASFIEATDEPLPGILLTAAQAREAAYVLLLHAEQMANGLVPLPPSPGSTQRER
jgi:hypothetical protein